MVGVKHDLMGQVPVAFVVCEPARTVSDTELRRHCREQMPPHMVPQKFILVDTLPRNEAGKLMREQLAARLAAG